MALIKCEECGKEISSSAKECPHCGYKSDSKVCPDCGKKVSEGMDSCPSCGCPLKKKTSKIISDNLDKITGARSESYVTFKDLFKDTFKKHSEEELDDVFICGGKNTTPKVSEVDPHNAKAWVYFKMLVFFIIAYIPTRIGFITYGNANFLPAMIMLAAFAVPVTVLIFFFEINVFRNMPFYKVMKYFILGGALSLIVAILFFSLDFNTDISTFGGHVAWAAIEGAALMYVKGLDKLDKKHLNDKRFLLICLIPIVLHGVWDMPINLPYYILPLTLTVLAWVVIIYFVNLGLKQVDEAKAYYKNKE